MAGGKDNKKTPEDNENSLSPMAGVSSENRPQSVNSIASARDSYWFAHGGADEIASPNNRGSAKSESKDAQLQKEREDRIRLFHEQKEDDRLKRLKELEESFVLSRKHRQQQEEERRKKIDEAKIRESDRRQQVEERKRQIWEAEQERKGAILRRNLEREARIEARRNAQRNSASFAFGSSTPRTFDLDLAALGRNAAVGCPLMSSVSGRRLDERDFSSKRATSACSLDRKSGDDCMSWSMTSLSTSSRGRRRTDLTPTVISRERSITPHVTPRGTPSLRAVSMTRLDQLAQPRRQYCEAVRNNSSRVGTISTSPSGPRARSPSMSRSMCNLANNVPYHPVRKLTQASTSKGGNSMSRSMMQLPGASPQISQTNQKLNTFPAGSPSHGKPLTNLRSAQSMTHLAVTPRLTRTARLRVNALANARQGGHATSMMNLHKSDSHVAGRLVLSAKDTSRSPSRPQSAMSEKSETSCGSSQASGVVMRPKPAPRKPRPFSIAVTSLERSAWNSSNTMDSQSRQNERNVSALKPPRAKSIEPLSKVKTGTVPAPKKPVPPPKSAQVLAKARSHPVPTKDNLRKVVKTSNEISKSSLSSESESSTFNETQQPSQPENLAVSPPLPEREKAVCPTEEPQQEPEVVIGQDVSEKVDSLPMNPCPSETKPAVDTAEGQKEVSEPEKLEQVNASQEMANIMENSVTGDSAATKPRITSEEEARAALAEKRRLAREQAEREAELERQRQEEIRRQEEECKRQEELEQKRLEEEQIRLAELHRKMEEEKLRKAIEEQEQREREERARQEEEAKLKAEKEEQERKAREEAEKQRIELEEKLRKEEQERAERKRRVEQIMSRTRGKGTQPANGVSLDSKQAASGNSVPAAEDIGALDQEQPVDSDVITSSNSSSTKTNVEYVVTKNSVTSASVQETVQSQSVDMKSVEQLDLDFFISNSDAKNGFHSDNDVQQACVKNNAANDLNCVPNRTSVVASSMQTNGFSSHEDSSLTSSPEERSEKSDSSEGLLLDLQSTPSATNNVTKVQVETNQLIDIGANETTNSHNNNNYMINVDVMNSNLTSGDPFCALDDNLPKNQENSITDLLS